ncbi:MAG: dihydroorotase [Candidatus Cybelea sp.]
MTALLIKGGRVVDPAGSLDALRDLRVRGGVITEIGEHLQSVADEGVMDVAGCIVAPGFVDMHVHLREPGFPEKETLATGTEAALRGGFTSVACMPNTKPALDSPGALRDLLARAAQSARCRVYPIAAITRERLGREPCDFPALAQAGAVAFSDDGDTVRDARVLRDAALAARGVAGVFISHSEDPAFGEDPRRPSLAEDVIVARDLLIAGETAKAWHIAHLSTALGLDLIRWARARGTRVTCEVTPHHLSLTADDAQALGAGARVNPPLRCEADCAALRAGVRDGTIDALATDHAPHTPAEKGGDSSAVAPGYTGLEIALGAYVQALPDLALSALVQLLSTNPARILGVPGGGLRVGEPADVTIFALREWLVDPSAFASKGRWTPFAGRRLPAKVLATIVAGAIGYRAAEFGAA